MNRKVQLTLVLLIPLLLFNVVPTSGNFSVSMYIVDAHYVDLDADGKEDDIYVEIDVTLTNYRVSTDVDVYVGITLPSGIEYWFLAKITIVKSTYAKTLGMAFDLLDTANEPGWYDCHAFGLAQGEQYSVMQTYTFDPPGGQSDRDPVGSFYFV